MGLFGPKKKPTPPPPPPAKKPIRTPSKPTTAKPTPAKKPTTRTGAKPTPAAPRRGPQASPTANRPTLDPANRDAIIRHLCREYADDRVQPDEIVIKANGEVWIDRRSRFPRAVPFLIGNWQSKPQP